MKSWILVHVEEKRCFDFVEHEPTEQKPTPFPVHSDLVWVDVTELAVKPQHGWNAELAEDGSWAFTNPYQPQEGE